MIYVIRYRGVFRGRRFTKWRMRAAILAVSALATGIGLGAALGRLGSSAGGDVRGGVAAVFAVGGIAVSVVELARGRRMPLLQRSRETNRDWMRFGAAVSAAMNGAAMGAGFVTRIGYWLWYAVPVSAFAIGSPGAGALVFGVYALTRAIVPVLLSSRDQRHELSGDRRHVHRLQDALTLLTRPAATLCAIHLLAISFAYL